MQADLNETQAAEAEEKSNSLLAQQRKALETLQKQKPPSDPNELVQYLMKRLEAAEESIKV